MSALDNCPFCGWPAKMVTQTGIAYAECTGCGAEGPPEDTADEAMQAWNRRPAASLLPDGGPR